MSRPRSLLALCSLCLLLAPVASAAQGGTARLERLEAFWADFFGPTQLEPFLSLDRELLTRAVPDECFNGLGQPYVADPSCAEGVPKVNEGYAFGLTKAGDRLWVGTVANMQCLVMANMNVIMGGLLPPHVAGSYTCELGASAYAPPGVDPLLWDLLRPYLGDWRPPHIYVYDLATRTRSEMAPAEPDFAQRIVHTLGIRSAGNLDGVVLMAGPTIEAGVGTIAGSPGAGINLFAFLVDGTYLGSTTLLEYNDIRMWEVVDGVLYTAVRDTAGGGSVLRWRGNAAEPFLFEVVGELDDEGAFLTAHEGRIFVTTWPEVMPPNPAGGGAGLWMSPPVPAGGLTAAHAAGWTRVWRAADYEADPVTAATYLGGALASFDGWLYWTSMHSPLLPAAAHLLVYGVPTDPVDLMVALLGTHRPMHVFRGRAFDTAAETQEVLYGLPLMPAWNPAAGEWTLAPSKLGPPRWGLPGFGDFYNMYGWTARTYRDQLFIGTMDISYMFGSLGDILLGILGVPVPAGVSLTAPWPAYGADLWRFADADLWALPESVTGLGNHLNYGVRSMVSDDALYLGTANPMNLATDPGGPLGGWELLRLSGMPPPAPRNVRNLKVPMKLKVWVPCAAGGAGEWVQAEGRLHVVIDGVLGPHRKPSMHFHTNFQYFKGVGQKTGIKYNVNGASNVTAEADGFPFELSVRQNFNVIGQGRGNDLRLHLKLQVTGLPGWGFRISLADVRMDCR